MQSLDFPFGNLDFRCAPLKLNMHEAIYIAQ